MSGCGRRWRRSKHMTDPIWTRLRRVLDRSPDSTKVELSRASAEEMLHEIARLTAEVERLRALLEEESNV